jgi:hypothetical protein
MENEVLALGSKIDAKMPIKEFSGSKCIMEEVD